MLKIPFSAFSAFFVCLFVFSNEYLCSQYLKMSSKKKKKFLQLYVLYFLQFSLHEWVTWNSDRLMISGSGGDSCMDPSTFSQQPYSQSNVSSIGMFMCSPYTLHTKYMKVSWAYVSVLVGRYLSYASWVKSNNWAAVVIAIYFLHYSF